MRAGSRVGSGQRTRGDPRVQAQSLHQRVVQEHSHQCHQDVGEAHVKHNRGPWGGEGNRGSGEPHPLHLPPPGTASSLCPKGADSPERVSGCPRGHTAIHSRARVCKKWAPRVGSCPRGFWNVAGQSQVCRAARDGRMWLRGTHLGTCGAGGWQA